MTTTFEFQLATSGARDTLSLDISGDLHQSAGGTFVTCSRGYDRATLGAQPRAGDLTAEIRNVDLPYSLYSPRPGLGLGLIKDIDATPYPLWQGTTDIPEHSIHDNSLHPFIDVSGLGPFSRLAGKKITSPLYESITTGAAMAVVLDLAGFPAANRDLDVGVATLLQWWCDDDDAFEMLKKLRQTEGITADLYESADGSIVFRDQAARFDETRSNTIQSTFTSEGAEPRLTGFRWIPEYREIINYAEHERVVLAADAAASVVWTDPEGLYIVQPNATISIDATASSGLPFKSAITPALGTDYSVGFGSITAVTLDRDSGVTTRINYTAGAAGAILGHAVGAEMQLRATAYTQISAVIEKSTVDATDSIDQFDLKPWPGEMWSVIPWDTMRDNLNAIVRWLKDPHGRVIVGVLANRGSAADLATATREIGDRIALVEPDLGVDVEAWIERIQHDVRAPARHFVTYECSVIDGEAGPELEPRDEIVALSPENTNIEEKMSQRQIVSLSSTLHYIVYKTNTLGMRIERTTDAGVNWTDLGFASSSGELAFDVFFEKWARPDGNNRVHITWHDNNSSGDPRGVYYVYFDLDTETFGTLITVTTLGASPDTTGMTIGMSRSGKLKIDHYADTGPSVVVSYRSDDDGATWSAATAIREAAFADRAVTWPDFSSADEDDLIADYIDQSANALTVKQYDWSGDSVAESAVGTTETQATPLTSGTAFSNTASTIDPVTGELKIISWNQIATGNTLQAWTVDGASVTARTAIETTVDYGRCAAIATDGARIWAFYTKGGASFTDRTCYYRYSDDDMVTWSAATAFATTTGDIRAIVCDPQPTGAVLAGYRIAGDFYFGNLLPVTQGAGSGAGHETNPFDDEDAGASLPQTVDFEDQGMMMRGAVAAAHFGIFEL